MNRTIEKLENCLRAFATNRRSGHTRTMMTGAANSFGVVVIVADQNQMMSMQGDYPRQTYITLNEARSLIGYKGPVVIDHYAVQVLISDALLEIDKLTKHSIEAGKAVTQAKREAANWEESAAQFLRNQEYYRGLVVKIGEIIGEQAYIRDDGSVCEDVLCDKVPEIIAAGKERGDATRIERDEWKRKYERLAAALEDYGSKSMAQMNDLREQLANAEKRAAEALKQIRISERRADEASAKDPTGLKMKALHDIAVKGLQAIRDGRYGLASTHAREQLKLLADELYRINNTTDES